MTDKVIENDNKEYGSFENMLYLIKNIWRWDKWLFLLMAIQIPAIIIIPLTGIYIPKLIVDSVINKVAISKFLLDILPILLVIIIFTFLVKATEHKLYAKASLMRMGYINNIGIKSLDTDFENIDGPKGQTKIQRATMAVRSDHSPAQAVVNLSVEFSANIIGFILYAGIISTLNPLIVVFILIASLINYFIGRYVNIYEHKNKENLAPIEKRLQYIREKTGDFKAAKDMRLYNMSDWFKNMYGIFLDQRLYFQKKDIYRRYFANIVDGILIFLRDAITYGFLIYSVLYRRMEVSNFILYFGAVGGISTWLSGIVKNLNDINSSSLNIRDFREFLETEDKMNKEEGVGLPKEFELPCDIELRNLYYKYEGAEDYTIKDINIHIKKGEKLALVGVNGAGKTTLVKLICGLYTPTKGEIFINGKSSRLYNRDEYYTLFSVVFQDTHLLPVSIETNIASRNRKNIDKDKMDKVLQMSDLKKKVDSLPKGRQTLLVKSVYEEAIDLSGGEIQKLMLARALYKDGPIMMLDEPTAALDPIAENEIYQKYNGLTKDKTSIYISHRLSSTRFCDRIVFIENGQIIEEGNHHELMKLQGKYKEMYDMQSHYYKDNIGGVEDEKGY